MEFTAALADPVFWKLMLPVGAAPPTRDVETSEICAVLVNDPNRPNTNPAMAMAAIRVMAMRMTVAMTGEMAFLPLTFVICMLQPKPCYRLNKNSVSTISV